MFKGHPWENDEFGAVEYYWYLARGYVINVGFDVNIKPFMDFCQEHDIRSNHLMMKIGARLSAEFLPQYQVALNKKAYPARYPAGYIRPVHKVGDMLEHVAIREKKNRFYERLIRDDWQELAIWFATHHPRLSVLLARYGFAREEIRNNYALMISRNPLRNLNTKVTFSGTHYRTFVLTIPYGEKVTVTFGGPHAFGNIQYYEPFLLKFKTWMEQPETIPEELIAKEYRAVPLRWEKEFADRNKENK